jgi:beta-lactam-binding protein with PASTA domain
MSKVSQITSIPKGKNLQIYTVQNNPALLIVPNIVSLNLTAAQAQLQLAANGFRARLEYIIDNAAPDGKIISQFPPALSLKRQNRKIVLKINATDSSLMPNLIGKTIPEVQAIMANLLLNYIIIETTTPNPNFDEKILAQSEVTDTILPKNGPAVTLTKGKYVPAVQGTLPNVVGKSYTDALTDLAIAQFNVYTRILDSAATQFYKDNDGKVKSQSPGGGTIQLFTTNVQLTTYAWLGVVVPNLSGVSTTTAQSQLSALGLNGALGTAVNTSTQSLNGTVSSQSPASGTTVVSGTVVTYNYYNYIAPPVAPPVAPPSAPPSGPPVPPSGPPVPPSGPPVPPSAPPVAPPSVPPSDPPATGPDPSAPIPPIDLPPIFVKSIGITTLVRTPNGLVSATDLNVGDKLLSANIDGFPYDGILYTEQDAINWSGENSQVDIVETEIVDLRRSISKFAVVINGDLFSDTHYILVKRDNTEKFIKALEVLNTDQVWSYENQSWVNIDMLEKVEVDHEVVSIDCEPYDMFFTEKMLTHDSRSV